MGSGKFAVDHDHFVLKNRMLAAAEDGQRKDREYEEKKAGSATDRPKAPSCFNCRLKTKCPEFRASRTGYGTGAASFGGDQRAICAKYAEAPATESRGMNQKQIKSLLKNFKRTL